MISSDDLITMCRLLQCDQLPEKVERELELRSDLYHFDGNSGRLGAIECIHILRSFGLLNDAPKRRRVLESVDFHNIKVGTTVWVKGRKGKYTGAAFHGLISVRFEDGVEDTEVRPVDCCLAPPIEVAPETVESVWQHVPTGSFVTVDIGGVAVPGELLAVNGDKLRIKHRNDKGRYTTADYDEDLVALTVTERVG